MIGYHKNSRGQASFAAQTLCRPLSSSQSRFSMSDKGLKVVSGIIPNVYFSKVGICDFDYAGTSDQFQLLICSKDSHNEEYSDCCLSESSGHVARSWPLKSFADNKFISVCLEMLLSSYESPFSEEILWPGNHGSSVLAGRRNWSHMFQFDLSSRGLMGFA